MLHGRQETMSSLFRHCRRSHIRTSFPRTLFPRLSFSHHAQDLHSSPQKIDVSTRDIHALPYSSIHTLTLINAGAAHCSIRSKHLFQTLSWENFFNKTVILTGSVEKRTSIRALRLDVTIRLANTFIAQIEDRAADRGAA